MKAQEWPQDLPHYNPMEVIRCRRAVTCMKFFLYKQKCFLIKETDTFERIVV